jgi:hypothetical protein
MLSGHHTSDSLAKIQYTNISLFLALGLHWINCRTFYRFLAQCKGNEHRVHRAYLPACLSVCVSVRMFQQKNRWTDFDDILHWLYATGGYIKLVHFNFLQPVIPIKQTRELLRSKRHWRQLIYDPEITYRKRSLKNMQLLPRHLL